MSWNYQKKIINRDNKLFTHCHIVFFTEENIKRIINAEHLLIDDTFVYPTNFYETIIIMFYDNLCNKMLPRIFISINNKTYEGYCEIFLSIKKYNLGILKNNISIVKWIIYTTDLEIALYYSFKNAFLELDNLSHLGCFFIT